MPVLETTVSEVEDDPVPVLASLGPTQPRRSYRALRERSGSRPEHPSAPAFTGCVTGSNLLNHSGLVLLLWVVVGMNEFI